MHERCATFNGIVGWPVSAEASPAVCLQHTRAVSGTYCGTVKTLTVTVAVYVQTAETMIIALLTQSGKEVVMRTSLGLVHCLTVLHEAYHPLARGYIFHQLSLTTLIIEYKKHHHSQFHLSDLKKWKGKCVHYRSPCHQPFISAV